MSQAGIINVAGGGGGGSAVETLTGNTGGAVPPTANNIFVLGTGGITVAGNPGGSTLTISLIDNLLIGTATTTDGTTYVSFSASANVPLPVSGTSASIRCNISGMDVANGLAIGGELIGLAKNVSGTVTIVGVGDITRNNDNALSAWTAQLSVSGTNVQLQVRGVAAHTINWRTLIDYIIAP
jgi:hypothetical protein